MRSSRRIAAGTSAGSAFRRLRYSSDANRYATPFRTNVYFSELDGLVTYEVSDRIVPLKPDAIHGIHSRLGRIGSGARSVDSDKVEQNDRAQQKKVQTALQPCFSPYCLRDLHRRSTFVQFRSIGYFDAAPPIFKETGS